MTSTFDEAMAQLTQWREMAEQQIVDADRMARSVDALEVAVWSTDREVRITLHGNGSVSDIEFTDKALAVSPSRLCDVITTTMRRAVRDLQDALPLALAQDGVSPKMADGVRDQMATVFSRILSDDEEDGSGAP